MDHIINMQARVYAEYRNSPKLLKWLEINPSYANEFEKALDKIYNILDFNQQEGVQLDLGGRIINQPRGLFDKDIFDWFGWLKTQGRVGWGKARWMPREVALYGKVATPDHIYRVLLRAKAAKNNSRCTIDGIADAIEYISDTKVASIDNRQDMTFTITFADRLPDIERAVIQNFDIMPRPQGVKLVSIAEPAESNYFGYIGDPFARPYGVEPYAEVIK
ncbi:structural protein [Vibrio phage D81]